MYILHIDFIRYTFLYNPILKLFTGENNWNNTDSEDPQGMGVT